MEAPITKPSPHPLVTTSWVGNNHDLVMIGAIKITKHIVLLWHSITEENIMLFDDEDLFLSRIIMYQ
jgi:hypothetical protein